MTTQPKQLTDDDFLRLHSQGVRGELIRGVLREKMPTGREHGKSLPNYRFFSDAWCGQKAAGTNYFRLRGLAGTRP